MLTIWPAHGRYGLQAIPQQLLWCPWPWTTLRWVTTSHEDQQLNVQLVIRSCSALALAAAQPLHLERSSLSLSAHSKLCHDTRGHCACTMPASTIIFHTVAPTRAICHTKHTIWQDSLFARSQGMQTTSGTTQRAKQPYSTSGTAPVHCAQDSTPSARVMVHAVSMTAAACYVRPPLELPGRELLRAGCTGIYLKPFGMRLLAAAASLLVIRHFLSTCVAHKRT